MSNSAGEYFGRYLGRLILEPLPDGRLMRLVEPFGFMDSSEKHWQVPTDAQIDGASIPRPLWTLIGGPFEGKYRTASVVHDYYCDMRSEPWRAVHRVFYNGMRASGVSKIRAKVMYAAVYFGGPRWSDTTVHNNQLPKHDDPAQLDPDQPFPNVSLRINHTKFELAVFDAIEVAGESALESLGSTREAPRSAPETRLRLGQIQENIEKEDPTLAEIENAIDNACAALEQTREDDERLRIIIELPAALKE